MTVDVFNKIDFPKGGSVFMSRLCVVMCVVFLFVSGCGRNEPTDWLAKIGDKKITDDQFKAYLDFKRFKPNNDTHQKRLIDQYLEKERLASAIENDGKLLDRRLIDAELNEFRKEMLVSRYFETYLRETITDEAVRNYYTTHASDFEQNQVNVAHILIRTNSHMTETERKAKLTRAQDAYAKVYGGKSFEDVAEAYSEDTHTAKKGGVVGWIREGSIDPAFTKMAFDTKAGEVSEPFETAFGYHVIKVLEGPMVVKTAFEKVAGDIRYQLRNKAKQAEMKRLMSTVNMETAEAK